MSTEQVKELQHDIQKTTRKLEDVQQKRLRAEEEIIFITRETKRRVDLMLEKSGVVDALQQLGHLLQEEAHLSEELNDQGSADSLQERKEHSTNKARNLAAEVQVVKQLLAEVKGHNTAAQALIPVPTRKSKRN